MYCLRKIFRDVTRLSLSPLVAHKVILKEMRQQKPHREGKQSQSDDFSTRHNVSHRNSRNKFSPHFLKFPQELVLTELRTFGESPSSSLSPPLKRSLTFPLYLSSALQAVP